MSTKKVTPKKTNKISNAPKAFNKLLLLPLILITVIIYFKSLNNQLINTWDDHGYITENRGVQTMHGDSVGYTLKKTFSTSVLGNYHPLTMLSYCLEYEKFKFNPKPYHVTNLIIHILNALLVVGFIWLLTQQQWVAFITALLFAIHPMHVESVAWVSERKDVLYTFFYLAALCTYILYLKKENLKARFYGITLLLFILALLSKAMAVSLPITFLAVDYFLDRKIISKKVLLEKVPFLVLSLIFGIVAIGAQKSANALDGIVNNSFGERIIFSFYGLMTYLWKMVNPTSLSCFYNYPQKHDGMLPTLFLISPIVILALAFLIYKSQRFGKDVVFGFVFFLITIVLVLQIFPVGDAIIADRYTYIPYIGLFFIIARWINNLLENKGGKFQSLKTPIIGALIIFSAVCCYLSFQQSKVWHDSISLWSGAIENFDGAAKPFNNRGLTYFRTNQYDKALSDMTRTIQLNDDYPDIHYNRGVVYFSLKKYDKALNDYNIALQKDPKFAKAYNNRGNVYHLLGKYNEAINDYTACIQYSPNFAKAYCDRAGTYFTVQKFQAALEDALHAKELGFNVDPRFIDAIQAGIKSTSH